MTVNEYKLPDVGEGLTEADIVTWRVKVGDEVKVNDVVVEIETAKSIDELPSPSAGPAPARPPPPRGRSRGRGGGRAPGRPPSPPPRPRAPRPPCRAVANRHVRI